MSKKLPKFLDDWERESLLKQPNPRYFTGHRNLFMFRLMLKTGLRLAETTNLQWEHINLLSGRLMVREGKGSKDRTLWLNDDLLNECRDWRERQLERVGQCPYIFTTLKGTKVLDNYVQQALRRYAKKAGIKHVFPHMLRHTFATGYLDAGGNIYRLQQMLGHSSIKTTAIYLDVSNKELKADLQNYQEAW